jgi:hypothetical protein
MADSILASERLRRKADFLKEQYSCVMAKYCWLKEGVENPTENQIQIKIIQLSKLSQTNRLKFLKPMGFKVNKFFLDNSWSNVIASEDKYYQSTRQGKHCESNAQSRSPRKACVDGRSRKRITP